MNIGAIVHSTSHPSKGSGLVVGLKAIFGREYVDVFFEKTKEKLTIPAVDLAVCRSPEEKLKLGLFSDARRFLLRLTLEQIRELKSAEGIHAAANFKIIPLPHQLLAVNFVLDRFKPRALIADEVGLGKTIEAALIYQEMKARGIAGRVLVIAPSGLCLQWREEMKQKFFEDFSIYDRETVFSLKKLNGEETNIWTLSDRIITSIDFIKPKKINEELDGRTARLRQWHNMHILEAAAHAGFDVVIIDEAHKLTKDFSGEETARFKVGKVLAETTPVLLLLTATPHQGDSAKFKNLLGLIDPYLFYKSSDLTPENVKKVTVRNNKRAAVDLNGKRLFKQRLTSLYLIERDPVADRAELELYDAVTDYVGEFYNLAHQQNDRTMMFLLLIYQRMVSSSSRAIFTSLNRRLDSLREEERQLAEMIETPDEAFLDQLEDMPAEELLDRLERLAAEGKYNKQKAYLDAEIKCLENCVDLARQACLGRNDAKFVKLLEAVDEFKIRENDPHLKFIIFTEFVETQQYLSECLQNLGYTTARINGRMSSLEKQEQKRCFQEQAQFLISTDAGGEGINLQFCRIILNYDLPWNPMRLEQRIGRIDRIGQEHDVKVINFQLVGTVEQRVREVIEKKLHTVREEFNDGEDKLADILSTLDDEFSFENIYINAVVKRRQEAAGLEELAREIYLRAREIISQGQLVIPFTEFEGKYAVNRRDLERRSKKIKRLIEQYLGIEGRELLSYRSKEGVYFFEDPGTEKRVSNVIFDARYGMENEEFELFSLSHPYVANLLERLEESLAGDVTAKLMIREGKFAGEKGFLFVYRLTLTNYFDLPREYLIPCFIGSDDLPRERISRWFAGRDDLDAAETVAGGLVYDLQSICCQADTLAEQRAEVLFYDLSQEMEQKVREAEQKMQKYYADKEEAIKRVAVENIRAAKLRELERDRQEKWRELARRRLLVPGLERRQIAYVEFGE